MNKQELINHIKDQNEWSGNHRFILIKKEELIFMIEDLDQPQKVKVPAFVDEWIKKHCYMGKYVCLERFMCQYNNVELPTDLYNYYDSDRDGARDKVISAILEGYEVEEEPKWVVKVNNMYFLNWGEDGTCPTFVIDDASRTKEQAEKYESEQGAESVAEIFGGTVEKV